MATGTLWAVNTRRAAAWRGGAIASNVARARAAIASTKRGCSAHAGAKTTSGASGPTFSRAAATSST
jgi:hypothetical protein